MILSVVACQHGKPGGHGNAGRRGNARRDLEPGAGRHDARPAPAAPARGAGRARLGRRARPPASAKARFPAASLLAVTSRTLRDVGELANRAHKAGKRLATLTIETEGGFASAAGRAAFPAGTTGA